MISKELLEILVCPKCKGDLTYLPKENGFDCLACQVRYPIVGDIPVFLIDQAKPLSQVHLKS